jgi:hypothetical protein
METHPNRTAIKKLAQARLQISIRDVLGSNLGRDIAYIDRLFIVSRSPPLVNAGVVP